MVIECVAPILWDMSVLAGLWLIISVCVVGTKGKHVSEDWLGYECGWFWKVGIGTQPCILIPHRFSEGYFIYDLFILSCYKFILLPP